MIGSHLKWLKQTGRPAFCLGGSGPVFDQHTLSTKEILFTWSPSKKKFHNITSRPPELNKEEFGMINLWVQPLSYDDSPGHTPAQNFHYLELTEIRQLMDPILVHCSPGCKLSLVWGLNPILEAPTLSKSKATKVYQTWYRKIILRKMAHCIALGIKVYTVHL